MTALFALRGLVSGLKTYATGAVMIALAILVGPMGVHIEGVNVDGGWINLALQGAALIFVRAGIGKSSGDKLMSEVLARMK